MLCTSGWAESDVYECFFWLSNLCQGERVPGQRLTLLDITEYLVIGRCRPTAGSWCEVVTRVVVWQAESYELTMCRQDVGDNITEVTSGDTCERWLVIRRTLDAANISIQVAPMWHRLITLVTLMFVRLSILTPSMPSVPNCCCPKGPAPYWSNPPFLIFDIQALWRSVLSARAPGCQKLKMMG